ncbi:hypothetical protein [Catenibacterium mitsuokai]|uniref:hypothetical protein n=1 Tax=Catenibacterium mitsuokai TaxID=100886 RepID=UPI0022E1000B|nr:hypothetical protein [Catenibacterium mitsuokai]
MKLQCKHKKFQADATKAFAGQPYLTPSYMMDKGSGLYQQSITEEYFTGWRNHKIISQLIDGLILENIRKIRRYRFKSL